MTPNPHDQPSTPSAAAACDLTVIMPLYNGATWLAPALDSVLNRAERLLEVIVVDDGSTDDGPAIAESFGPRVRLVRQDHGGAATARNTGIRAARGTLIGFLDADDLWAVGTPDPRRGLLDDARVDIARGWVREFSDDPGFRAPPPGAAGQLGAVLARRATFDRFGWFDQAAAPSEDIEWFLRVRDGGAVSAVTPHVVVDYRRDRRKHLAAHERGKADLAAIVRASLARKRANSAAPQSE